MKITQMITQVFCSLIILSSFLGCSSDNPQPGCFQDEGRSIVATINNANGTIVEPGTGICPTVYTIQPNEGVKGSSTGYLFPCNISEEFKVDGLKIVFSGYVYEIFDTEDVCADSFEITEIQFINP
jgi:hypothetical protein